MFRKLFSGKSGLDLFLSPSSAIQICAPFLQRESLQPPALIALRFVGLRSVF
jgi:hypothetical protein